MKLLRQMPISISAIVLLWALQAGFGFESARMRDGLGFGVDTHSPWWTVATSALTATTCSGAVLATLALVVFGGVAERQLGAKAYLAVAVGAHLAGLGLGAATARLLEAGGLYWGTALELERVLNPFVWLCGATMYASAKMGPMRRHRLRTIFFALTITLILYAGVMADFAFFFATLVGWAAGQWRYRLGLVRPIISIRESRILVALVFGAVFVGPLLSSLNPDATAPFANAASFILPHTSSDHVSWLCERKPDSRACLHALAQLRVAGIGPFVANLMPLVVVVVIALGLVRGRSLALKAGVIANLCAIAAIANELRVLGQFTVPLACYLALPWLASSVLLLLRRDLFRVELVARRRWRFVGALFAWWLLTAVVWLVGARLLIGGSWLDIAAATPLRYIPPMVGKFATFDVLPTSAAAWVLTEWTGIVFWLGFIALFQRVLQRPADPGLAQERALARSMLQRGSGDHLSWMTLWPGNSYWFGPDGYVAYQLHNGIAVTVGEPVSCGGSIADLASEFEREIYATGAQVAWYSVRADFAASRSGWDSVLVAEESVVAVRESPEFKGKKFQDIRTARNRAEKEGIRCEWTTWADCSLSTRAQITAISEDWVSEKALPEMGFTLGGLAELDDPEVRLMLAFDAEGTVHGVTSWLPAHCDGAVAGLVLDFMRRRADGFRPVVEFLIASTLEQAHQDGLTWVSLSGAPLAAAGSGTLGQVLDRVGHALEPLYGFRSLAAFKKKFNPDHEQWVLAYRDEFSLPAIGMAVSKCYLPNTSVGDLMVAMRARGS
ncbi:DUF2156 domain-containing protein [Corynebacterium sp. H128]|uniref:bifunctional lysylphosphatidylglycerol flippase/synthetase MprF n=1 Tax=Corynebacterium sp. H128 TaxID=3133427 RepID=UPI0030AA7A37